MIVTVVTVVCNRLVQCSCSYIQFRPDVRVPLRRKSCVACLQGRVSVSTKYPVRSPAGRRVNRM